MKSWESARQTTGSHQRVLDLLAGARTGGADTDVDLAGLALDHAEGLQVQLQVLDLLTERGDELAGWKVSYTSGTARDRMGKGFRPFGYLLASHVFTNGTTIRWGQFRNMAVEPELCLRLARPLEGYITPEEARAAVAAVIPAFELNELRYGPDADDGSILADGCGQWGVVLGEESSPIDDVGDLVVRLQQDGTTIATGGPNHIIDNPFRSLAALSAGLATYGKALRAGDLVITGSFSRSVVTGPGRWSATFEGIGDVTVGFEP